MAINKVLRLDVGGTPMEWISKNDAAAFYAKDMVVWTAGERTFRFHGGISRITGKQSILDVNSIIAVRGINKRLARGKSTPPLKNSILFYRDRHMCMYCGSQLHASQLTRDHVFPVGRGGADVWSNVVTACVSCNRRKGCHEPHEVGMELLAIPYEPDYAQWLICANRRILADQMEFLASRVDESSEGWIARQSLGKIR